MKEYTPSEKSTEELREYIARLIEESEHMTEWPDVDIVVDDEQPPASPAGPDLSTVSTNFLLNIISI